MHFFVMLVREMKRQPFLILIAEWHQEEERVDLRLREVVRVAVRDHRMGVLVVERDCQEVALADGRHQQQKRIRPATERGRR